MHLIKIDDGKNPISYCNIHLKSKCPLEVRVQLMLHWKYSGTSGERPPQTPRRHSLKGRMVFGERFICMKM